MYIMETYIFIPTLGEYNEYGEDARDAWKSAAAREAEAESQITVLNSALAARSNPWCSDAAFFHLKETVEEKK